MRRKKLQSDDVPARLPLSLPFTTVVTTSFSFVALGNDDMDGWARYRLLIGRFPCLLTAGLSVPFASPFRKDEQDWRLRWMDLIPIDHWTLSSQSGQNFPLVFALDRWIESLSAGFAAVARLPCPRSVVIINYRRLLRTSIWTSWLIH
jgi:hypothetical protein